jgi:hypothetical protein
MALDDKGSQPEVTNSRPRARPLVVRAAQLGIPAFTRRQIALPVGMELAKIVPQAHVVCRFTGAPGLGERARRLSDRAQVVYQGVPSALAVRSKHTRLGE